MKLLNRESEVPIDFDHTISRRGSVATEFEEEKKVSPLMK
jgi:hypothetical protein